jgi:hypothetical protein
MDTHRTEDGEFVEWGIIPSKSLKLLPILGVPSLPSLPFPLLIGLLPANSAVLLGDNGPVNLCLGGVASGRARAGVRAAELADESDVWD